MPEKFRRNGNEHRRFGPPQLSPRRTTRSRNNKGTESPRKQTGWGAREQSTNRGVGGRGRRRGGGRAPPPGQAAARPRGGAPREEAAGAEERGRRAAREAEPDHLAGRGSEHRAGDLESSGVMHGNERYADLAGWLLPCYSF